MARFNGLRNNFSMGEVSPAARVLADTPQYKNMCEELTNFLPLTTGGVTKRKGTQFVSNLASNLTIAENLGNMIPYTRADGEEYLLFLTNSNLKAYRISTGTWITPSTLDSGTYGSSYSLSYSTLASADGYSTQWAQQGDFLFIALGSNEPMVVYSTDATTFYYGRLTQVGRVADDSTTKTVSFSSAEVLRGMPYLPLNTSGTTLAFTGTSGTITVTASSALFTADMVGATSGGKDIAGTVFRIKRTAASATATGCFRVTGFTSSTVVTGTVLSNLSDTLATTEWQESAWSRRRGFPRAVTIKDGRIFWGGSDGSPDTVWASQLNDLFELATTDMTFAATIGDDDAYSFSAQNGTPGKINFMSSEYDIFCGTGRREMTVGRLDSGVALGALNTESKNHTSEGCSPAVPAKYDGAVTFIDRSKIGLKEAVYDYKTNAYSITDLRLFANHMFSDKFYNPVDLGYPATYFSYETIEQIVRQHDNKVTWVRAGGSLYSCSRDLKSGTLAWARHILGGTADRTDAGNPSSEEKDLEPQILGMCVVKSRNISQEDHLYLVVNRTLGSTQKYYLEKMVKPGTGDITAVMGEYLDCSIGASDTAKTTWTSLAAHLASETVHVVADGSYLGTKTLNASGTLTLTSPVSEVWVGYHSDSVLVPVQIVDNSLFGTGVGPVKRIETATVVFERTVNALIGVQSEEASLDRRNFRQMSVAANEPTPLFTGQTEPIPLNADYENKQNIMIKQDWPLPMTVLAINVSGVLYD